MRYDALVAGGGFAASPPLLTGRVPGLASEVCG